MSSGESDEFDCEITTVDQLLELDEFTLKTLDKTGTGDLLKSLSDGSLVLGLGCNETLRLHAIIVGGPSRQLESICSIMDTDELEEALATGIAVSGLYTADTSAEFRDLYPPNILMDKLVNFLAKCNSVPVNAKSQDIYGLLSAYDM
jgi:hypothetical protein